MAKVLLINPVVREDDEPRHVPYGLALLAAIADREGHQIQVYDANAWRKGEEILKDVINADDWDVIATGGITTTYGYVKKICQLVRRHAPRALLLLGGGILTSMPGDMMGLPPQVGIAGAVEAMG